MNYLIIIFLIFVANSKHRINLISAKSVNFYSDLSIEGIVGGEPATPLQAPWQVWIVEWTHTYGEIGVCGGAIIGNSSVLTAAHCCDVYDDSYDYGKDRQFRVLYGGINREKLPFSNNVTKMIKNPGWNKITDGDWCLLILEDAITESAHVKIVKMADKLPEPGAIAHVTGWGLTHDRSNETGIPVLLHHAQLSILDQKVCENKWSHNRVNITRNMICATSQHGNVCNYDSGSPLVVNQELVGVVSFGQRGCPLNSTDFPSVYGNVVTAKQWVEKQISNNTHFD